MRGPGAELIRRKDIADKCRSCGSCRAVCPIFEEIGREDSVARGKVALIRAVLDGELGLTEIFDERVQLCLNCMACVDACPNDVRVDDLILSARSGLVEAGRLPFIKRFVFRRLLRRGRLLPPVGKATSFLQRVVLRGLPKHSSFRLLLPAVGIDRDRVFPQFARRTFLETVAEIVPSAAPETVNKTGPQTVPGPDGTARVAYFVGCAANLIYPESARAAIEALNRAGVDVVVPKSQGCCGTPVFNAGDFVTAREMAARNIEALRGSGAEAVVTACASCGLALKREYAELLGFKDGVGMPVYDLTEYLVLRGGAAKSAPPAVGQDDTHAATEAERRKIRVTYHDPCHLVRGQGVYEEPRQILRSIPWVEFVEMLEADRCCGGGGSFSLSHYDLSKAVARRKVEAIRDADVDIVATECQACVMQLTDMLAQAGMDVAVVSVAELAAQRGVGDGGQAGGEAERRGAAMGAWASADSV